MPHWYFFSIAALLLLGSQRFLYKVAAERNCSSTLTTAVFMGTVTLLSGAVFIASDEAVGDLFSLLTLALLNSASFALATLTHMEALRHLPAGITFPLTRLSILAVIVFSVFHFGERPGVYQWIGILTALAVVVVLAADARSDKPSRGNRRTGFALVAVCVLCGAVAAISSKFAAISTSKAAFMSLSYLLGTFFSLAIAMKWRRGTGEGQKAEAVKIGLLMGILNFFGFYAFLLALASGPLSVIALITGMHFVIAILLSMLVYQERMTARRILGLALTLLAFFFLQLCPPANPAAFAQAEIHQKPQWIAIIEQDEGLKSDIDFTVKIANKAYQIRSPLPAVAGAGVDARAGFS